MRLPTVRKKQKYLKTRAGLVLRYCIIGSHCTYVCILKLKRWDTLRTHAHLHVTIITHRSSSLSSLSFFRVAAVVGVVTLITLLLKDF